MKKAILFLLAISISTTVYAWDGTDQASGESVEIESGNLVRRGEDIEVYDYNDHTYHNVQVESINRYGNTVEIEVYDNDKGETRILEMDGSQH